MSQVIEEILSNLNEDRNTMLMYRLVNSQWKDMINTILEKRIFSRKMEAFPRFGICADQDNTLRVWYFSWKVDADQKRNLFPAKSLTLIDVARMEWRREFSTQLLPIFLSNFGSNLTTLELSKVRLGINEVATILSPLISLKLLIICLYGLSKVGSNPQAIPLLTPITQPKLSTLVIKNHYQNLYDLKQSSPLYVWLVASFAAQLEELDLDFQMYSSSWDPPEFALLPGYQCIVKVPQASFVSLAPFPDSAFCKLTKLNTLWFGPKLLQKSVTPALQQLVLKASWLLKNVRFEDFCGYIDKCANTLENIRLDAEWEQLLSEQKAIESGGKFPTSTVQLRKVKTLSIPYPTEDAYAAIIKYTLLPKFPNLQSLNLLNFYLQNLVGKE